MSSSSSCLVRNSEVFDDHRLHQGFNAAFEIHFGAPSQLAKLTAIDLVPRVVIASVRNMYYMQVGAPWGNHLVALAYCNNFVNERQILNFIVATNVEDFANETKVCSFGIMA